ncbi:MAG: hypothetical protein BM564_13300 [Bacteroidetes bacterium MedPE-SWsnd-G2]|nr:MAG: hypothetical protein BM564_13300 [Bacteroidetes bacterium MedPE-SWsnd-G2]
MPNQSQFTDVLIIGGGPSGASTALSILHYSNIEVTLIEHSDFSTTRVGEQVSSSIFDLLSYLKLNKTDFKKGTFSPSHASKSYWGSNSVSTINSIFSADEPTLQMNRENFDFRLIEAASNQGAIIYPKTKCLAITQLNNKSWDVLLIHPNFGKFTINAKYLVDASGRSGSINKKVGAACNKLDSLMGVGMFVNLPSTTFDQTIESVENGWWYTACLPNKKAVLTLFTDSDIISDLKIHQNDNWTKQLTQTEHIKSLFHLKQPINSKIWVRNAQTHISDSRNIDRYIAVGDAAASFDPISSMGLGFSISSAIYASKHIINNLLLNEETKDLYQTDLENIYSDYLKIKSKYYAMETRWSSSKFWNRRN